MTVRGESERRATVIDGSGVSREVKRQIKPRVDHLAGLGKRPGLGTILVGHDPASHSYVAGKHRDCAEVGIESIRLELPGNATGDEVLQAVQTLNEDPRCTGFIVQLPLPAHLDMRMILEAVDRYKASK